VARSPSECANTRVEWPKYWMNPGKHTQGVDKFPGCSESLAIFPELVCVYPCASFSYLCIWCFALVSVQLQFYADAATEAVRFNGT